MSKRKEEKIQVVCWCALGSDDMIRLRLADEDSDAGITVSFTPEQFTFLLSHRQITAPGEVCNPDVFGKIKVTETRTIRLPDDLKYDREKQENWLRVAAAEDGWEVNPYLRSQNSVTGNDQSGYFAHYTVFKHVDKEPE